MQLRLLAVLSASLVALSGAAAWSDGMPAQSHHVVKKKKVVRHRTHVHTPDCPPGEDDDSYAVADQLNHEEWLRHRQQDLGHRSWRSSRTEQGGWDQADLADDFADGPPPAPESRYGPPPSPRGHSHFERRAEHWRDGRGGGYVVGQRDGRAYGHAWGDADRRAGPPRDDRDERAYRYEDDRGDAARWAEDGGYAGEAAYRDRRDDDARFDRRERGEAWRGGEARRAELGQRRVIVRRQVESGSRESYGSSYSGGYGEGYGHGGEYGYGEPGYGRGGAYVGRGFYYETGASYAGRDAYGYLTWPGKTPG